jgi:hypothetical protein
MADWLVKNFAFYGMPGQNWMLATLAIILISIAVLWWLHQ